MAENKTIRGLVSVVMPVYNVASCVGDSISSILNQSYTNWELLLVNDGSSDASGSICDDFARRDDRIKVFHIANAGVSNARNIGIRNSLGEYLMFCDSDDLISPDFMKIMIHKLNQEHADMVRCFMKPIGESVHDYISGLDNLQWKIYEGEERVCLPDPMYDVVWGKLYRRAMIADNRIEFDRHINRGEDTLFASQTVLCSYRIVYSENQLVNYRVRIGSLMRSNPSVSLFQQSVLKYRNLSMFIDDNSFDEALSLHLKNKALNCAAQDLVRSAEDSDVFSANYKTLCTDGSLRRALWKVIPLLPKRVGMAVVLMLILHSPGVVNQVRTLVYAIGKG